MEDLRTDTVADYENRKNAENLDLSKENENECAANLLNGVDDIDDPLDLMDNCDNASIGSNSDVWKGSDSEDESFDKDATQEKVTSEEKKTEENDTNEVIEPESKETEEQPIEASETPLETTEKEQETSENHQEASDKQQETSEKQQETSEKQQETTDENQQDTDKQETAEKQHGNDGQETNEAQQDSGEKNVTETQEKLPEDNATANQSQTGKIDEQNKNDVKDKEEDAVENISDKDPLALGPTDQDPLDPSLEKDPLADVGPGIDETRPNNDAADDDGGFNEDEDYDFDPSLLCPEVSMAVDDNPVITNSGGMPAYGNMSPLPYEPVFSTYVDEVTGAEISFNLTAEEQELRRRLYGPTNPVQMSKIHCTACNVHLGSALEGQTNRFVHPLLKVLICKECYHFYTSGEFEKDEDGSELYCRWCGQGGQVLCCSKCEFVFCKRCIRTNFGRKKMFEIRDSDSWDCFRCHPSQLITQRIACYEFFEYVRREQARASTSAEPDFWSKDYTRCCSAKKRPAENGEEVKKQKRKKGNIDPDYSPLIEQKVNMAANPQTPTSTNSSSSVTHPLGKGIIIPKPIQYVPTFPNKNKDNDIEFVRTIPAPQVTLATVNKNAKSNNARPNYRTILPNIKIRPVQPPQTLVRINTSQPPPLLATTSRLVTNPMFGRPANPASMMKHEWFEKTVRAAARVNSHLSYTLTQLNKAQTQAASVEELAVVHNKLQEILSSSINSLIQIRKNLRTEFIAGIKTVRLPTKKPESFSNDDDVIFVSAPSTSSQASAKPDDDPIIIIEKTATTNGANASEPQTKPSEPQTKPSEPETKPSDSDTKPKAYLKVKSVMELQNVPSECITIPDDPPEEVKAPEEVKTPEKVKIPEKVKTPEKTTVCNGVSEKGDTPQSSRTDDKGKSTPQAKGSPGDEPPAKRAKTEIVDPTTKPIYNIKEVPSPEIKKMLSVTVKLPKVNLEDLQKRLPNECH